MEFLGETFVQDKPERYMVVLHSKKVIKTTGVMWKAYSHGGTPILIGQRMNNLNIKKKDDRHGVKHYYMWNIHYVKTQALINVPENHLLIAFITLKAGK